MGLDLSLHVVTKEYVELNQRIRKGLCDCKLLSDENIEDYNDFMNDLYAAHYKLDSWFEGIVEYLHGYKQGIAIDFVEQNPKFENFMNDYVSYCVRLSELNFESGEDKNNDFDFVTFLYFDWDIFHDYVEKTGKSYIDNVVFMEKLFDNFDIKKEFIFEKTIYTEKKLREWEEQLEQEDKTLALHFSY